MDIARIFIRLGESPCFRAELMPFWETSLMTYPGRVPSFLLEETIEEQFAFGGLPSKWKEDVFEAAAKIRKSEDLLILAWHAHRRLIHHPESGNFDGWPRLDHLFRQGGDVFYFLVALSTLSHIRTRHLQIGVAGEVTRDTCKVVASLASIGCPAFSKHCRLPKEHLHWLRHHVAGRIFRLGRFEWLISEFPGGVHVFRKKNGGQVIAIAEGGQRVTSEGFIAWEEESREEGCWNTEVFFNRQSVTGFPVKPTGTLSTRSIRLDLDEWEHRLSRGMPCLDLHIPSGGAMIPEACRSSFLQADRFFKRTFPSMVNHAFVCRSWILNPDLQSIFSKDANLVQFQRQLYLFPIPSSPKDGFCHLFGRAEAPAQDLPEATSLQKTILSHLRGGRRWRGGGMFYLPEDLPLFGNSPYV